jgi:hypothetical protein
MPITPGGHSGTFDKSDYIVLGIGIFKCAVVAVEVIKGDIDNSFHLFSRHRSLQYLTSSQFLAHFLRHSKGKLQRWQVLGANPFFVFAMRIAYSLFDIS